MVQHLKQTLKKQLKNNSEIVALLVMVIGTIALMMAVENHREANRQAYAKAHNCTWHWMGTMYGDNRDYICK